jgi:integrase
VHGLRKNAAVALAEVGCEPHEIMAITGHKTLAMVTHYTKRANQKRLADRAMEKWKTAKSG